jgi:hypothetical protein
MMLVQNISDTVVGMTPEIGKIRAGIILVSLLAEASLHRNSTNRMDKRLMDLGLYKSIPVVACLGSTNLIKSNWVYLPTSLSLMMFMSFFNSIMYSHGREIDEKLEKIGPAATYLPAICDWTLFTINAAAKVVNSFAIGLFAQRIFRKDQKPGLDMLAIAAAMLALSIASLRRDRDYPLRNNQEW